LAACYANENFPLPVVEELRRLGHDVLTSNVANQSGLAVPDEAVLDYAIGESRAVLTLNRRHFIALHRNRASQTGIVVCTVDRDFIGQARRIHDQVAGRSNLNGELIRVNRPHAS
jgi:Domain of unknown function (DUF5615)